jgi:DNA mismatch repair protein MLH1
MSDGDSEWMAQAHFTNANYHSKKFVLLLFINSEKLVNHHSCGRLKSFRRPSGGVLENQEGTGSLLYRYSSKRHFAIHLYQVNVLPLLWYLKSTMLCSIQLDPTTVDVNVHPTKREVHFLDEEAITECIADAVQTKLTQSGERTFEYQVGATSCVRLSAASYSLSSLRRSSLEASLPQTPIYS